MLKKYFVKLKTRKYDTWGGDYTYYDHSGVIIVTSPITSTQDLINVIKTEFHRLSKEEWIDITLMVEVP